MINFKPKLIEDRMRVGHRLYTKIKAVNDLSASSMARRAARKIHKKSIILPDDEKVLDKPVHVIPIQMEPHLLKIPHSDIRKALEIMLASVEPPPVLDLEVSRNGFVVEEAE